MKILIDTYRTAWGRFGRFILAGLVNTAVAYVLYAGFLLVGLNPQASLALSFVLGVLWNYMTTARFVFDVRGFGRLPAYAACYMALYLGNVAALQSALDAGLSALAAQAIIVPFAAVLSFLLLSRVMKPAVSRPSE